jgi:hypothetical protein
MFGSSAFAETPFSALPSTDVSISITGVIASGALGSITTTVIVAVTITGVLATGTLGQETVTQTVSITGVAAIGAVGTVNPFLFWGLVNTAQTPSWTNINTS